MHPWLLPQAVSLVCGWLASVNALVQCAWAYTQKDAWRGVQDSLAEQLQAAAARVQRTLSELALPATADGAVAADSLANMRRLCLQPAAELAALVQQYLEHPLYEADRRRSVMRVVARRCCAYLGCTNVEAGGGPAARQGAGSRRCRCVAGRWLGTCGLACG